MSLARETGFIQRVSKIPAKSFLKMLLFDHLQNDQPSLEQHSFGMYDDSGINISKQAIDKKFNEATVLFIQKLFEKFLMTQINNGRIVTELQQKYSAIRIMDSTEFKLPDALAKDFPGYSACNALACAAIQFEYDIISRKINCMAVENARTSDKTYADKRMDNINPGELIIRDLGYYSVDSYKKIEDQEAFYVSRLKPQVSIYKKVGSSYEPLTLASIITQIKKSKGGYFDQSVFIGREQKKEVRLIAWLLPEKEQHKRLCKKKSRKGRVNKDDEIWSKLNVFITNIPSSEITPEQVYQLYKIRWQIELMFKIWKSILKIHLLRKMKPQRVKCYLYSKFIWILLCWDITVSFEPVIWKHTKTLISPYKCYGLLRNMATEIKKILFNTKEKIREWLQKIVNVFIDYGLKENKKGKTTLETLLQFK